MWSELKKLYTTDHLSKQLKAPGIRLNALNGIERLLQTAFPSVISNPHTLYEIDKNDLKTQLEKIKGSQLNSAESSVINGLYKFLPNLNSSSALTKLPSVVAPKNKEPIIRSNATKRGNEKLETYRQIAEVVCEILEEKGYPRGKFMLSKQLDWIPITPSKSNFPRYWKNLCDVYHVINGHDLQLDKVIQQYGSGLSNKLQEADIYFYEPFELIVEYDEEQHFNQFRLTTLENAFYKNYKGFDTPYYVTLSNRTVKPGSRKSGFSFLKSADPLFPENLTEDKQDNRHRQRAFRDMMKDLSAAERSIKPLIRIPASITGWKRGGLSQNDLQKIREYLKSLSLFTETNAN